MQAYEFSNRLFGLFHRLDLNIESLQVRGQVRISTLFTASITKDICSSFGSDGTHLDGQGMLSIVEMLHGMAVPTQATELLATTRKVTTTETNPQVFFEVTAFAL